MAAGASLALAASIMTITPAQASTSDSSQSQQAGRKQTKLKVKVSAKKVTILEPATVSGKVSGPKRKVMLQVKNDYGWRKVDADKSNKKGKFSLKAPTGWYGKRKLRVVVPRKGAFGPKIKFAKVKVNPDYAPLGKQSSFTPFRSQGYKIRYNPCKQVTFQINPSNLPADGAALVTESIFRIEKASGLRYKYKGTTNAIPWTGGKGQLTKNANLGIAWTSPDVLPDLASTSQGNVLGVGGIMQALPITKRRTFMSTKTGLSIDYTDDAVYGANRGFDNGASLGAVMMHELTHAAGLDHTTGAGQLMRPFIEADRPALFGKGDIKGLNTMGIDSGCLSRSGNARAASVDVNISRPFALKD